MKSDAKIDGSIDRIDGSIDRELLQLNLVGSMYTVSLIKSATV